MVRKLDLIQRGDGVWMTAASEFVVCTERQAARMAVRIPPKPHFDHVFENGFSRKAN